MNESPIGILLEIMMGTAYPSPSPRVMSKCSLLSLQDPGFMEPEASATQWALPRKKKNGHKNKHRASEGPVQAKDPEFILHELHGDTIGCPGWFREAKRLAQH